MNSSLVAEVSMNKNVTPVSSLMAHNAPPNKMNYPEVESYFSEANDGGDDYYYLNAEKPHQLFGINTNGLDNLASKRDGETEATNRSDHPTQLNNTDQKHANSMSQHLGQNSTHSAKKRSPIKEYFTARNLSLKSLSEKNNTLKQFSAITANWNALHECVNGKIDECTPADYEVVGARNQIAPEAKKVFDRNLRYVYDYPELRMHFSTAAQILRHKKTGDTWTGGVVGGVPNGWGYLVSHEGEIFDGLFINGLPRSHLRFIDREGILYEGNFFHSLQEGKGTLTFPDGTIIECDQWHEGIPQGFQSQLNNKLHTSFKGILTELGPEGHISYQCPEYTVHGYFKDGKSTNAKKIYQNGKFYCGSLDKEYFEEGHGELTFIDGRKFLGNFTRGLPNGKGIFTSDKGPSAEQTWVQGRRV